jgi:hypothetical protein
LWQQIESGFDDITEIDPEICGIVRKFAVLSGNSRYCRAQLAASAGQASARPMMRFGAFQSYLFAFPAREAREAF